MSTSGTLENWINDLETSDDTSVILNKIALCQQEEELQDVTKTPQGTQIHLSKISGGRRLNSKETSQSQTPAVFTNNQYSEHSSSFQEASVKDVEENAAASIRGLREYLDEPELKARGYQGYLKSHHNENESTSPESLSGKRRIRKHIEEDKIQTVSSSPVSNEFVRQRVYMPDMEPYQPSDLPDATTRIRNDPNFTSLLLAGNQDGFGRRCKRLFTKRTRTKSTSSEIPTSFDKDKEVLVGMGLVPKKWGYAPLDKINFKKDMPCIFSSSRFSVKKETGEGENNNKQNETYKERKFPKDVKVGLQNTNTKEETRLLQGKVIKALDNLPIIKFNEYSLNPTSSKKYNLKQGQLMIFQHGKSYLYSTNEDVLIGVFDFRGQMFHKLYLGNLGDEVLRLVKLEKWDKAKELINQNDRKLGGKKVNVN